MSWDGTLDDLDAELEQDSNASYYHELDQAAMVEADRLQDEVADRDAEPAGPYEHTGAYQGSELFDTTGVPHGFCPDCEHAPCVAGAVKYCESRPRFIVAASIVREIRRADLPPSPWCLPAILAASELLQVASDDGIRAHSAMETLAYIRADIRQQLQAPKDES